VVDLFKVRDASVVFYKGLEVRQPEPFIAVLTYSCSFPFAFLRFVQWCAPLQWKELFPSLPENPLPLLPTFFFLEPERAGQLRDSP